MLFVIWSQLEYNQLLPWYYTASNWLNREDIWKPFFGVFLSPSRGLFIFSPFAAFAIVVGILFSRFLKQSLLFWLCGLWLILQALTISTTRNWWGGYSFGPRLFTDAFPAIVMMTIVLWHKLEARLGSRERKFIMVGYLTLALPAIFIHSYQGLFNINARLWNGFPSIDEYPEYLFDWKYPQFLTTLDSFHTRRLEHYQREFDRGTVRIGTYSFGETLTLESDRVNAILIGWWTAGWTETKTPSILFMPEESDPSAHYKLGISASSYELQETTVFINGSEIGSLTFEGPPATQALTFNGALLMPESVNQIELHLPNASFPSLTDIRRLGLSFAPHRLGLASTAITITALE
jgi:hypothetical protein